MIEFVLLLGLGGLIGWLLTGIQDDRARLTEIEDRVNGIEAALRSRPRLRLVAAREDDTP